MKEDRAHLKRHFFSYRDKSSISYFTPDLCRTIFFNFKEVTEVEGIRGYKYWLDTGFLGNNIISTQIQEVFCMRGSIPLSDLFLDYILR